MGGVKFERQECIAETKRGRVNVFIFIVVLGAGEDYLIILNIKGDLIYLCLFGVRLLLRILPCMVSHFRSGGSDREN